TAASGTSTLNPMLEPLGNYGGPIETMLPAPLSPLLCQGTAANATAAGLILDERNDPRTTTYGATTCVDIGAAQSNYSLSFVQQPTTTILGLTITPSPTVQWKESGIAFDVAGQAIPITAAAGALSGTTPQNTNASGVATFGDLSIGSVQSNDTLTSTLPLSTSPAINVSATSSQFNMIAPVSSFTIMALPSIATAGTAVGFTVTAMNGSAVSTHYTGTITISSSQDPLLAFVGGSVMYTFTVADAGVHTFTAANGAVFKTAGSDTLTVTDTLYNVAATSSTIAVSAAPPTLLSAVSGSGQSVPIGGTFTTPLKVKVTDVYGNANSGVTVTYTAPGSGASLAPAVSTAITGSDGTASLAAIANATASSSSYTAAASVTGIATPVNFTLTNTQAASLITVAQVAPLPVSNGTGVNTPTTFVATLSDATQNSAGLPTGTVQFFSGSTPIGSPVPIANAQASVTTTFNAAGNFNITAQYLGDNNFTGSSSSTLVEVVVAPSYTLSLSPTSLTITGGGTATTTLTITPVGDYQGTITLSCSGLVAFSACGFVPATIALSGSNTPQQVAFSIYTLGPSNTSSLRPGSGTTLDAGVLWLPGIALAALLALRRRKLARRLSHITGLCTLLLLAGVMLGLAGCTHEHYYTPVGTDTITVNAVGVATPGSGSANLNQTVTLTFLEQ
ncbi:MAG TPA: Ig-like domain-containing protein, partial [Acidobacteriaceae bacterium]|nr:Ig-like domain-containing protein [Acidobacteriaceae bacterium]